MPECPCGHEHGDHYIAFDGSAGCKAESYDSDYDESNQCNCFGWTIGYPESTPSYPSVAENGFIADVWKAEMAEAYQYGKAMALLVNRDFEDDLNVGDTIKIDA